jgi:hypothetical protein
MVDSLGRFFSWQRPIIVLLIELRERKAQKQRLSEMINICMWSIKTPLPDLSQ